MSIRSELAKIIRGKSPEPITRAVLGKDEVNPHARRGWFDKSPRRVKIARFIARYERGGPYAEAIDAYPLFTLSKKWTFECKKGAERLKDEVVAWADQAEIDLDSIMKEGILSAVLGGDGYQEIVPTADGSGVWKVVTRDPSTFEKVVDEAGTITGYVQFVPKGPIGSEEEKIGIDDPARIINLMLFRKPGGVYGQSIWDRAEDDIDRDCDVIESITKSIHRHGTPKQQWDCGTPENPVNETDLKLIEKRIEEVGPKTDFATSQIKINMLDTQGVQNVDTYSNVTLRRVSAAMGVPEELLGLGSGSTEATATVRLNVFYDKVTTIQEVVARTYNRALIDKITSQPGSVWIQFNQMSMDDFIKLAGAISQLRSGPDPDAIADAAWARERLGIPPDSGGEELTDANEE